MFVFWYTSSSVSGELSCSSSSITSSALERIGIKYNRLIFVLANPDPPAHVPNETQGNQHHRSTFRHNNLLGCPALATLLFWWLGRDFRPTDHRLLYLTPEFPTQAPLGRDFWSLTTDHRQWSLRVAAHRRAPASPLAPDLLHIPARPQRIQRIGRQSPRLAPRPRQRPHVAPERSSKQFFRRHQLALPLQL